MNVDREKNIMLGVHAYYNIPATICRTTFNRQQRGKKKLTLWYTVGLFLPKLLMLRSLVVTTTLVYTARFNTRKSFHVFCIILIINTYNFTIQHLSTGLSNGSSSSSFLRAVRTETLNVDCGLQTVNTNSYCKRPSNLAVKYV